VLNNVAKVAAIGLVLAGCNGKKDDTTPKSSAASKIDASLCETDGKRASQFDLNKDGQPDVWFLFKDSVVTCKLFDFDRDGKKDWVVAYNAQGATLYQRADFDFDGKFDMLAVFENNQASEIERDTDFDGNFDVKELYTSGEIASVRRDRNRDTKPDVWEEYRDTVLVSVKYDDDYDGNVDRTDDNPSSTAPAPTPPPADPSATPPAAPAPAAPVVPAGGDPTKK
jgi:hypothetical protein